MFCPLSGSRSRYTGDRPGRISDERLDAASLKSDRQQSQACSFTLEEYARETQSRFAEQLLVNWDREIGRFWQVVPKEMLTRLPEPLKAERRAAEAGDD
jgi:glutamate synthase (NADPH/NADH) large chain